MRRLYKFLKLFEELVDLFGNPGAFPVPTHAHVTGVVSSPLVISRPAAPFYGEAFVHILEVIAHVAGVAVDFFGLFAAGVGEVAVRVGLAVTLQDSREGAVLGAVVIAATIILAMDIHPGNGLILHVVAFGEPDIVIGHSVGGGSTHASLHVLHQRVAEHGAVAEARDEYAARVNAVVFVQGGKCLGEEIVVALALVPQAANCVERDKDVVAVLVEHLLAVIRCGVIVVCGMVHKVFAAATVAVQCEKNLMRFCIVVVLGQSDKVFAAVAANLYLELVAIFDALDFLQFGIGAAALTRGRRVAECIAELERFFGLLEFYVECGIERAERHGKRVIAFEYKADCFALGNLLHKDVTTPRTDCTVKAAIGSVGGELEILLGATHRDLCEISAAGLDFLGQVESAGALQSFLENLMTKRVENFHLHRRSTALRVRENAVIESDISDRIMVEMNRCGRISFIFVNSKFTLIIRSGSLAFFKKVY